MDFIVCGFVYARMQTIWCYYALLHIRNILYAACIHAGMKLERKIVEWKKQRKLRMRASNWTSTMIVWQHQQHQQLPAHRHHSTQWNFILPSVIIMNNSSWNYRCETILEKRSWSNKLTHHQQHTTFTRDKIKREMKKQNRTHIHYGITITVSSVCLHTPAWACVHLFIYFEVFNCASIALFHLILCSHCLLCAYFH